MRKLVEITDLSFERFLFFRDKDERVTNEVFGTRRYQNEKIIYIGIGYRGSS